MSNEETSERIMYKEKVEGNQIIILEAAKAELAKAKEKPNRAKESSVQSWLDSEPLIDELEKQKKPILLMLNRVRMHQKLPLRSWNPSKRSSTRASNPKERINSRQN